MGVSTNGMIGYGVTCEEGAEFPWSDYREEAWWRRETGYQPIHEPYTKGGNLKPGWAENDPRIHEYFKHKRQWTRDHPMPALIENFCSDKLPIYALLVPSTYRYCLPGDPETFDPASLVVDKEEAAALGDFLAKYEIETDGQPPRWLLMSFYG